MATEAPTTGTMELATPADFAPAAHMHFQFHAVDLAPPTPTALPEDPAPVADDSGDDMTADQINDFVDTHMLHGTEGADRFEINDLGVVAIDGFEHGKDKIVLAHGLFPDLPRGALSDDDFAYEGEANVLHNGVEFATMTDMPTLTGSDFVVV